MTVVNGAPDSTGGLSIPMAVASASKSNCLGEIPCGSARAVRIFAPSVDAMKHTKEAGFLNCPPVTQSPVLAGYSSCKGACTRTGLGVELRRRAPGAVARSLYRHCDAWRHLKSIGLLSQAPSLFKSGCNGFSAALQAQEHGSFAQGVAWRCPAQAGDQAKAVSIHAERC